MSARAPAGAATAASARPAHTTTGRPPWPRPAIRSAAAQDAGSAAGKEHAGDGNRPARQDTKAFREERHQLAAMAPERAEREQAGGKREDVEIVSPSRSTPPPVRAACPPAAACIPTATTPRRTRPRRAQADPALLLPTPQPSRPSPLRRSTSRRRSRPSHSDSVTSHRGPMTLAAETSRREHH
jgi:hypothetical protein